MVYLTNFLLGILFILMIIPIIENLTSLLLTAIEVAKGYLSIKVTLYNLKLQKMSAEEDTNCQTIGFQIPEGECN